MSRELHSIEGTGLVTIRGAWFFVVGTDAEFILDYPSYDPRYDPVEDANFRRGLAVVRPQDGFTYLQAMNDDGVYPIDDIPSFIDQHGAERVQPIVLIDFDNARFVSTFFDLPLEDHAGTGWESTYEDLFNYVPHHIAAHWTHDQP